MLESESEVEGEGDGEPGGRTLAKASKKNKKGDAAEAPPAEEDGDAEEAKPAGPKKSAKVKAQEKNVEEKEEAVPSLA